MRRYLLLLWVGLFLSTLAVAQGAKRGPSTPEERQRFVTIAHKIEESPLDPSLVPEREWGLRWLIEVPDVNVNLCAAPLQEFVQTKYKYSRELVVQLTFSSGAFLIEHPDNKDPDAQYVAGIEGVLKAYQSILKTKPDAKSKALDDLAQRQSQGTLSSYVRDAADKGCNHSTSGGL
jgi:hypothetical protein